MQPGSGSVDAEDVGVGVRELEYAVERAAKDGDRLPACAAQDDTPEHGHGVRRLAGLYARDPTPIQDNGEGGRAHPECYCAHGHGDVAMECGGGAAAAGCSGQGDVADEECRGASGVHDVALQREGGEADA